MSDSNQARNLAGASVTAILDALGRKRVARACGVRTAAVRMWAQNGGIPAKHHAALMALAGADGHTLSYEDLQQASFDDDEAA